MMWLCAVVLLATLSGTAYANNGIPPFMLLSPPQFKAGHTSSIQLMLFTESVGNITVKYFNYTQTWYPENTYDETILALTTMDISADDKIIDIQIRVPATVVGRHNIQFRGYIEEFGSFEFTPSQMTVGNYGYKTYVQTDKPLYKPGQPVRFRGFSVDSDLKGLMLPEGLAVRINNPDGVQVFDETINLDEEGVIHGGMFLLAEEAKLGVYTIVVTTGASSATCTFSVEEYVLPKFGIEIEGPGYISKDDTTVKGKVSATYTYGKPVSGSLKLKFAIDNTLQRVYMGPYLFRELTVDLVDGKADWEIDITDLAAGKLKYLFNPWCTPSKLVINATVSDENGAFNVEAVDSSTKFSQSSLKLTFNKNTQRNYATGFPYYVEIDAEGLGVSQSEIEDMPVKLTMVSGLSDLKYETKNVRVRDGKVYASFDIPEDACAVKITAEMDIEFACDAVFACFQPERIVAKSEEFVRFVKTEPASFRGGDQASYRIVTNNPDLEVLHFIVMSKGNIVKSWHMNPEWEPDMETDGRFTLDVNLMIPQDMITRSRLLVLTANANTGYILADAMDVCVVEKLRHNMDLTFDKMIARPGENVTVYLTSDPKSFVGISVTDASLNLLREPCKVLTEESTLSFLRNLDSGTSKDLSCRKDDPYQCKSSTEVKVIDIIDLLRSEGLDINTNMNLFNYMPPKDNDYYYNSNYEYYRGAGGRSGYGPVPSYATEMEMAMTDSADMMSEAMDIGENKSEAPEEEEAAPRLRNYFPEAWLWTDVVSDASGKNVLSVVAPDTITGWVGSAFGLSPETGLGFSNEIEFQTFQPFFVSLDLPYSGTVGERITVPVRVFNYLDSDISADVRIYSPIWDTMEQSVDIAAGKAATIDYTISLTEAGDHDITVEAYSYQGESDAIVKSLLVLPGGEKIVNTTSLLIMEDRRSSGKAVLTVDLPENFIPGSHDLKLTAVGDILGEAVSGISNLIQLPSGCGEQNMHKVAVNVFSANYLMSMYRVLPDHIGYNIRHNLNVGIQQQLAYRKGSTSYSSGYSVFSGGECSDWLTAFVMKIINKFPQDVFLPCGTAFNADQNYLYGLIDYSNGHTTTVDRKGWAPFQYSSHDQKNLYWHSYFLISLLEGRRSKCGFEKRLTDSDYYSGKVEQVCNATLTDARNSEDCCYHHMVSYALQLCQQNGFLGRRDLDFLTEDKCIGSSNDGQYKFATCQDNLEYRTVRASSRSIEATGYAAMWLMSRGQYEDSVPMILWLASQRSENGGFRSSQDTVIGLQALSMFAEFSSAGRSENTDLVLVIGKGRSYFEKILIDEENRLAVKEVMLTPTTGDYKIKWTGEGAAFVQMISTYHVSEVNYAPVYRLKAEATLFENSSPAVAVKFQLPREASSTMFLLEVSAPTGLVFTKAVVEGQMQLTDGGWSGSVTRYDIKENGQRLHLYLDPSSSERILQFTIPLTSRFTVTNRMPAQVTLVDYYEPSLRQTVFYSIGEQGSFDQGTVLQGDASCSLSLTCDDLRAAEGILIGYPAKMSGDLLVVKNALPYKACRGTFVKQMKAKVGFARSADVSCVEGLDGGRSFFLLRYKDETTVEITGMASYDAVLSKVTECYSVISECGDI